MISFQWPWIFLLLPLPILLRLVLPATKPPHQTALLVPFFNELEHALPAFEPVLQNTRWKFYVLSLIWILLVSAAARPLWVGESVELPVSGRDLMLAVDVSPSMQEEDLSLNGQPVDRLTVLKTVITPFIEQRSGDRLGLILFGGQSYLQTPLTFDRNTVKTFLNEAEIGIAGDGTAIGDAIALGLKRLINRPAKKKVLILVTDGANTAGELSPRRAAELAAQKGLIIYAIGVGADEMNVPGLLGTSFGAYKKNPSRDLDEGMLKDLAALTGGRFFRARTSADLTGIYQELDRLEPTEQAPELLRPQRALFIWPLAFAFVLSLVLVVSRLLSAKQQESDL